MTQTPERITAIGGLGGSGTRVFAAMLRHAGVYIGDDLNGPLDNLWFTVLFKRRDWTRKTPQPEQVVAAIRLFRQAMTLGLSRSCPTKIEAAIIVPAGHDAGSEPLLQRVGRRFDHAPETGSAAERDVAIRCAWPPSRSIAG